MVKPHRLRYQQMIYQCAFTKRSNAFPSLLRPVTWGKMVRTCRISEKSSQVFKCPVYTASADDFAILRGQSQQSWLDTTCINRFCNAALISKFRDELVAIPLSKSIDLIKPGEFIFHLFSKINVTFENVDSLLKVIDSAMDVIAEG